MKIDEVEKLAVVCGAIVKDSWKPFASNDTIQKNINFTDKQLLAFAQAVVADYFDNAKPTAWMYTKQNGEITTTCDDNFALIVFSDGYELTKLYTKLKEAE